MRKQHNQACMWHGIPALVLCGLASLPLAALADTPVANSSTVAATLPESTQPSGKVGGEAARNAGADWDGLVTLVVSYLESASHATVTVASAEPTT